MLNVGKRTPSDPMEFVCRDQSPSDFIESQFARDLVNIHHGIVLDVWGAKCRQTDAIGSDGVRLPRPESIGLHRKSVRETLSKYSSRYSSGCGGVLNVGKRTPSDPMESVGRDQSPSDFNASQFARDLVNIHHGIVLVVVGC